MSTDWWWWLIGARDISHRDNEKFFLFWKVENCQFISSTNYFARDAHYCTQSVTRRRDNHISYIVHQRFTHSPTLLIKNSWLRVTYKKFIDTQTKSSWLLGAIQRYPSFNIISIPRKLSRNFSTQYFLLCDKTCHLIHLWAKAIQTG